MGGAPTSSTSMGFSNLPKNHPALKGDPHFPSWNRPIFADGEIPGAKEVDESEENHLRQPPKAPRREFWKIPSCQPGIPEDGRKKLSALCVYIYIYMYITLHYHTLHYITLHYHTLHYITLPYITIHYITLHYITIHYITLPIITLHYMALHCITLPYITIHYHTLPYITIHNHT